jgi:hypothetical protein
LAALSLRAPPWERGVEGEGFRVTVTHELVRRRGELVGGCGGSGETKRKRVVGVGTIKYYDN